MKNTNTIKAFLSVAIISLFAVNAFAQDGTDQATVTASANILEALSIDTSTDLDFGDLFPGGTETIASDAAEAASFEISGDDGAEITAHFSTLEDLTGGGDPITVTYEAISNTTDDTGTATAFTDVTASQTTNLSGTGELYIWLGGSITAAAGQATGSYTGDIILDVSYTSI
ncbi:MAG: DUF4402 domain-containing protein [Balneolales bacterium]